MSGSCLCVSEMFVLGCPFSCDVCMSLVKGCVCVGVCVGVCVCVCVWCVCVCLMWVISVLKGTVCLLGGLSECLLL